MKKFFIRLIAAASAAAICITSVSAYLAQFADGWSNGGMFDCTWSSAMSAFRTAS